MNDAPNVEVLLAGIAERLNGVVPSGFQLRVDRGMVWFGASGSYAGDPYETYLDNLTDPSRRPREDRDPRYEPTTVDEVISAVAFKIMDELQDEVDEETREPWPGPRTVPEAHAAVEEDVLYLWFGDRETPSESCEPLPLADLV